MPEHHFLHDIAVLSGAEAVAPQVGDLRLQPLPQVVICGSGPNGRHLARVLKREGIPHILGRTRPAPAYRRAAGGAGLWPPRYRRDRTNVNTTNHQGG